MTFVPGYGETPVSDDDLVALHPDLCEALGDDVTKARVRPPPRRERPGGLRRGPRRLTLRVRPVTVLDVVERSIEWSRT